LYLNAEETDAAVQTRIWDYAASAGVTPNASWPLDVVEGLALGLNLYSAAERKDFVERFLAPGQYDVLVIDPLRNVHTGDEDSSTDMTPMYQAVRDWTSRYGITLILVHHTPKLYEGADLTRIATWSRGSTALPAILDWANMLRELNVYKTAGGTNREMSMLCKGRPSAEETYKLVDLGDPKGFRVTDL
jgi:RecA-family ATPase